MGLFSDRGGIDRRGGRLVNVMVVPELARGVNQSPGGEEAALHAGIHAMESLSNVLINAAAFGQYSLAGLVLPPAVFATPGYPRGGAACGAKSYPLVYANILCRLVNPGHRVPVG